MSNFKIFWKWTLNRYKRVDATSSLNNYWRVLKMHLLDKTNRDFDQRERRNIKNVRCRSLYLEKLHVDISIVCNISTCSSSNIVFALFLKKNRWLISTIFIFFFTRIEYEMMRLIRTSDNEFKSLLIFLSSSSSSVDHASCLILESNSKIQTTRTSLLTLRSSFMSWMIKRIRTWWKLIAIIIKNAMTIVIAK